MQLFLTNTLSGKKELFVPLHPGKVLMYVCGITPYDFAHMGHGRCYVVFDVLYRLLRVLGHEVTYCRNFTDIDDKLLARAELELADRMLYTQVAQRFIAAYHADMRALNCMDPSYEPLVTQTIPAIISFVEQLIQKGVAYESSGDVYFSVRAFSGYGQLSKRKIDQLQAGARVQVSEIKRDVLDFALWKAEPQGQFWQSPWGYGRPGWHIECSAMAKAYLGNQIDIHGGGMDLMFPHHENERAQSEGLFGTEFVRMWLHNAFVTINQEKMSKSLGNFFTLKQVFEQYHPMVVRFYFLSHYFRAPLDFSFDELSMIQKGYERLARVFLSHTCASCGDLDHEVAQVLFSYICDDLNSQGLFGYIFSQLDMIRSDARITCAVKSFLEQVLGLQWVALDDKQVFTSQIEQLLAERENARARKDWVRADQIRAELVVLGYQVHDKKM